MGKHAFWMVSFQCLAKSLIVIQQICRNCPAECGYKKSYITMSMLRNQRTPHFVSQVFTILNTDIIHWKCLYFSGQFSWDLNMKGEPAQLHWIVWLYMCSAFIGHTADEKMSPFACCLNKVFVTPVIFFQHPPHHHYCYCHLYLLNHHYPPCIILCQVDMVHILESYLLYT